MSPTTRVGESDPNRGTAPEAITPGRYTGRVAVVTGSGSGIGRATRAPPGRGGRRRGLPRRRHGRHRGRGCGNQHGVSRGGRAGHRSALRRHRRGWRGRRGGAGRRGTGHHHQSVQHRRHRWVRPHARAIVERLGQDHRGQPDGDLPHVPGRAAGHARTRARRGHRQYDLHRRHEGPALFGRLLRLEGRRAAAHDGAGGRVHGAGRARQRRCPRRRRHADHPQFRPARRCRLEAHRAADVTRSASPTRTRSPERSPTSDRARRTTSPGRSSPSTGRSRPDHVRHVPGRGPRRACASRSTQRRCSGSPRASAPSATARWRPWRGALASTCAPTPSAGAAVG